MSGQYNRFTAFLQLLVTFTHGAMPTFSTWFSDVTTTNHASISLFILVQKVGVFFRESYLRMDMWKEQMSQRHGHDIQSRLNLIGATRWWSKYVFEKFSAHLKMIPAACSAM